MIGSETLANLIADAHLSLDEWDFVDEEHSLIPDGFKYLGSGSCRHAFLGPDGFVYKINNGDSHGNESNYSFGMMIIDKIKECNLRLADFDFFTDSNVMVQEYVQGEEISLGILQEMLSNVKRTLGFIVDIHEFNVFDVNGEYVLIDW